MVLLQNFALSVCLLVNILGVGPHLLDHLGKGWLSQICVIYKSCTYMGIFKCRLGTEQALKEKEKTMNT